MPSHPCLLGAPWLRLAIAVLASWLLAVLCAPTARGESVLPTAGAASIESNFPDVATAASEAASASARSFGYPTRLLTPLRGLMNGVTVPLFTQAGAAFQSEQSAFDIRYDVATNTDDLDTGFFGGAYDFMVSTVGPSASRVKQFPSLGVYPLLANAVAYTYNLGASVTNGRRLALRPATLCRIYRNNITRWNDPAIQQDNPGMGFQTAAADQPILLILQAGASGTVLAFAQYCGQIDKEFSTLIPAVNPVVFPSSLRSLSADGLARVNSLTADSPFSIAITTQAASDSVSQPVGALINSAGEAVLPTSTSQALTLYELGSSAGAFIPGVNDYELVNPTTPEAWPMVSMSYVYIDKAGSVSTCANKKMLMRFLLYFWSSDVIRAVADSLSMLALPKEYVDQLGLMDRLQSDLTCLNVPLLTSNTGQSALPVSPLAVSAMRMFTSFYSGVDTGRTFSVVSTPGSQALQRVVLAEEDFALINTGTLTDDDVALLAEGRSVLIPGYFAGVNPIFSLPSKLASFVALPSTSTLHLPSLYPIKLDMELCTRLFIGEVPSWLDAELVQLNPQLPVWFNASGADPTLQLIVGATAADDPGSGGRLLFQRMAQTATAAANPWAFTAPTDSTGPLSNPFLPAIARSAVDSSRANFTLINVESRLSTKCAQVPGSVSYTPMTQLADPLTQFQFVDQLPAGADPATPRSVIDSSTNSMKKCGAQYTAPEGMDTWSADEQQAHFDMLAQPATQRAWLNTVDVGCWPLSTLLSFAVKTTYASSVDPTACDSGLHSLEFIHYLQSTSLLTGPTEALGLVRLASFPLLTALSQQILRGAVCDGGTLLVILPYYWRVSGSVTGFGQAVGILGLLCAALSSAAVLVYRHKVVVRSASVPFLLAILLGMGLLSAAALPWAVAATRTSCTAFLWLANLGFMLLFCPLFAKTWRVWRIFSGAHLKVVKISNHKLMLGTAAVLLADVALIAAWQGVAPLVPVQYERTIGGAQHEFAHCSVQSGGAGLVFAGLVACEKGLLLLFGALMAFSTRNVKGTFNESVAISWAIYNTLLSAILTVALIAFVQMVEDALVLLVLILIMWVVLSAWGLIFGPKFHLLTQSDEQVIEASRSQITQEKSNGFSFASIAAMTTGQVKQFYVALKLQVNKAERVLELPLTVWGTEGSAAARSGLLEPTKHDSRSASHTSGMGGTTLRSHRPLNSQAGTSLLLEKPTSSAVSSDEQAAVANHVDVQPAGKDREADRERQLLRASSTSQSPTAAGPRLQARPAGPTGAAASLRIILSPSNDSRVTRASESVPSPSLTGAWTDPRPRLGAAADAMPREVPENSSSPSSSPPSSRMGASVQKAWPSFSSSGKRGPGPSSRAIAGATAAGAQPMIRTRDSLPTPPPATEEAAAPPEAADSMPNGESAGVAPVAAATTSGGAEL